MKIIGKSMLRISIVNADKVWGSEPWKRASGESICETCKLEYWRHKTEKGPGYGFCSDEILFLKRLCDGTLVKL